MANEHIYNNLVSTVEVQQRLRYPVTDQHFLGVIDSVIASASERARFIGRATWHASNVPPIVKAIVLDVCNRALSLEDGTVSTRAGDETEMYTDMRERTGTVFFTDEEKETIREASGRNGNFGTIATYRHSEESVGRRGDVRARTAGGYSVPFMSGPDPMVGG